MDFIWIGEPADEAADNEFERLEFVADPLVAVIPTSNPLASMDSIPIECLRNEQIIIQDNSSIEQRVFLEFCQQHGMSPSLISVPGSSIPDFVRRGTGTAIMLKSVAEILITPYIRVIGIQQSPVIRVSLLYLKDSALSDAASHFLDFIVQWKEDSF